jgi:hypothetical protein
MRWTWLRSLTLSAFAVAALAGCEAVPSGIEPGQPSFAASDLQKVQGLIPAFRIDSVLGSEGGVIGVDGYMLIVPRGAVAAPTRFVFESIPSGFVEVRLTATRVGSDVVNDVGSAGFTTPLLLAFAYEPAGGMPAWARLVVAYVRPDGKLERVPSGFDPRRRLIVGFLHHFSQYAVASD